MPLENQPPASTNARYCQQIESFINDLAQRRCEKNLAGVAIGVIAGDREMRAIGGWADSVSNCPVSESTLFEVGSLSKLFTSLLLAVAANRQEVDLDDPIQEALGDAVTVPTDGDSEITYRSLANHRSSLPRLPADLIATADMENPYVHYDQEMLYSCLNGMQSLAPIGSRGEYSNFAVGLLGHALGKVAGSDYRRALEKRVLSPLGMQNTVTEYCEEKSCQLATAHKKKNRPTKHWDFTEVTVAAGGVRSSLADMLQFLRANIDPASSILTDEIMLMRQPSELPQQQGAGGFRGLSRYGFPLVWLLLFLGIFAIPFSFVQWQQGFHASRYLMFPVAMLAFGIGIRWSGIAATVTAALASYFTWWHFGEQFGWVESFLFAGGLGWAGSQWKRSLESRGGGDGRLAWQVSTIDGHQLLWHNGRVGGSASFLGIIEELNFGVVVMTNTARSVDATGLSILTELIRLRDMEHAVQRQPGLKETLTRWQTRAFIRLGTMIEQWV